MKIADLVSLSTRMFKTRPMRTFLTVLGVGVGIGTVLFLVSLGYGLQNIILSKITTADSLLSLDVSPGVSEFIQLDKESIDVISQMDNVAEVSPVVNLSAQLATDNFTGDGLVYGVEPSFFRLGGVVPEFGESFETHNSHEAVISSAAVKLFNLDSEQMIGEQISLVLFKPQLTEEGFEEIKVYERKEKYTIKGVVMDDNTSYVFIPIDTIQDLDFKKYEQLKVKVSSNEFMEETRGKIVESGFVVSSLSDTIEQANKIFRVIQIVLSLFGFVALVVSAIGMFNTMTIALLERTNEIGIMRSIGASSRDVKCLFLVESMLMGFLGGVGGILIGYLGGEIVNFGINLLARNFGGQTLNLFYRPMWFVVATIVFSSLVGFLTGVYPSFRAGKLNPLDALRYK